VDLTTDFTETISSFSADEKFRVHVSGTWSAWSNDPANHVLDAAFRYKEKDASTAITPIPASSFKFNGVSVQPFPNIYNLDHTYWYYLESIGTDEIMGTDFGSTFNNSGGLNLDFFRLADTVRACQSYSIATLSDFVEGQNLTWYTSSTSLVGSATTPLVDNNLIGLTEYWITQTIDGCESERSPLLYQVYPLPVVDLGNDTTVCLGPALVLDAGNLNSVYLWNDNSIDQTFEVSATGTYSVEVTNRNTCKAQGIINVTVHDLPVVDLGNDTIICEGSKLVLDAGSVNTIYSIEWTLPSTILNQQTLEVSTTDIYAIKVSSSDACYDEDTITLTVQTNPVVDLGDGVDICNGESVTLDAQNSTLSYLWSTNESTKTIEISDQDTYSVTVTDALGCKGVDDFNLVVHDLPVVDFGKDTTICQGGKLVLDAGAVNTIYTIEWTLPNTILNQQTLEVSTTDTYAVKVSSSATCYDEDTISLAVQANPIVDLGDQAEICVGETFELNAQNPTLLKLWSTNESTNTIEVSDQNSYSVTVTDALGCKGVDDFNLIVHDLPVVDFGKDTTICEGGKLVLDVGAVNMIYTIEWTLPNTILNQQTLEVSTTDTYAVKVSSSATCYDEDTIAITLQANPVVDLGDQAEICVGETFELDAQNPTLLKLWSTNESTNTIEVSDQNTYSVTVTDALGCKGVDDFSLIVHDLPTINMSIPSDVCYNAGNVSLQVEPSSGLFSGIGVLFDQLDPKDVSLVADQGSYIYYHYIDENNCSNRDSAMITLRMEPVVNVLFSDTSICVGDHVLLSASFDSSVDFEWFYNGSVIDNSNTTSVQNSGIYTVTTNTAYCISEEKEVNVTVLNPEVEVAVLPEETIQLGESAELIIINPSSDYSYIWSSDLVSIGFGESIEVSPTENTDYEVTATIGHCQNSANATVVVIQPVIIPSMFTPNGDGLNDVWGITGLESYSYYELKVYNRWGDVVYDNYRDYQPWGGMIHGSDVPAAVYYYVLSLGESGETLFNGSVTILR